jgi:quercetin dioxygenase-like cupin family protein
MNERRTFLQTVLATALASHVPAAAAGFQDAGAQRGRGSRPMQRQPLPAPFTGMDAAFAEVHVQPGVEGRPHKHSGFVLGYVIEGEYLFATNGEPPRTVKAGEMFYEPPGATHSTSSSANGQPVKLLAIVIGPENAPITIAG